MAKECLVLLLSPTGATIMFVQHVAWLRLKNCQLESFPRQSPCRREKAASYGSHYYNNHYCFILFATEIGGRDTLCTI